MVRGQSKTHADKESRLIDAAMYLAARRRWGEIIINDIAQEAGLSAAEALVIFPSKHSILDAFSKRIDQEVLSQLRADPPADESPKDLLFDILMRRFEIMSIYRAGLARLFADLGSYPCAALRRLLALRHSMSLTLEAAGISAAGPGGSLRLHGLIAIYIYCLTVWFKDESEDLATTMAAVDKGVSLADKVAIKTY